MKGGRNVVLLKLDKSKLERRMALAGLGSYDQVAEEARRQGLKLSPRTIYGMVNGENWSKEKLEALCQALRCQPADIVDGWKSAEGSASYTHGSPQLAQELERVAA